MSQAVAKTPPFEQGGKGLCDAVILESYVSHARDELNASRVLVVSDDGAVKRSSDRFTKNDITVEFLSGTESVEKLKSLLNDETAAYIESRKSRLKEYVLAYENAILDFVRTAPLEITDVMLNGLFVKAEDRVDGSIKNILSVRPTRIANVIGGVPTYGETIAADRYPVQVFVEIEIDLSVLEYGFGLHALTRAIVQPDLMDKDRPIPFESSASYQAREVIRTVKRNVAVLATLNAQKTEQDIFDDFRIEKII